MWMRVSGMKGRPHVRQFGNLLLWHCRPQANRATYCDHIPTMLGVSGTQGSSGEKVTRRERSQSANRVVLFSAQYVADGSTARKG